MISKFIFPDDGTATHRLNPQFAVNNITIAKRSQMIRGCVNSREPEMHLLCDNRISDITNLLPRFLKEFLRKFKEFPKKYSGN